MLCHGETGSAITDFVMVGVLVALLFAGLLQLGIALDVRNTLIDCVGEGARFGALADRTPADGAARARTLIEQSLPDRYADQVSATGTGTVVEVEATVPLPLLGLFGGPATLTVRGHGAVQGST